MNDKELASQFIKVQQKIGEINILVCNITWPHPHEPVSNWKLAAALPLDSSSEKINYKVHEILDDKQYFQICKECERREPRGWMHNQDICQGCAQRNHDIVY